MDKTKFLLHQINKWQEVAADESCVNCGKDLEYFANGKYIAFEMVKELVKTLAEV